MTSKSELKKSILRNCLSAFKNHDFNILKSGNVTKKVDNDFLVWVGLNVAVYDSYIEINPFVGIHCVPIMKLISELEGEKYSKGRYATFAMHLGNICPEVNAFHFYEDTEIDSEALRLVETVNEYGVSHISSFASYDSLLPILEENIPSFGGFPQRVAVCLLLMGKANSAIEFVERKRCEYQKNKILSEHFERFAIPFIEYVKKQFSV